MDEDFEEMTAEELAESAIGYMGELLDEMDFDSSYDDKSITVRAANGDKIVFTAKIKKEKRKGKR